MEQIILILAALITSSISVTGMGGGIILLGIMAILIPEGYMVIALHGIIQMVSNGTRTFVFRNHIKKTYIRIFHWCYCRIRIINSYRLRFDALSQCYYSKPNQF